MNSGALVGARRRPQASGAGARNQPVRRRLTRMKNHPVQKVMRALSDLPRKHMIRAVALVAVMAFPLMAYAQLGSAAKAIKLSKDTAPAAAESVAPAKPAAADSCANQHWPFFTAECLRGSSQPIKPRLVSMNVVNSPGAEAPNRAAADHPRHVAASTDARSTPVAKPRKPARPRVARARKPMSISYAANAAAPQVSLPGW
jgi:hypothetical protein